MLEAAETEVCRCFYDVFSAIMWLLTLVPVTARQFLCLVVAETGVAASTDLLSTTIKRTVVRFSMKGKRSLPRSNPEGGS